jgi:hypothetical protein
MDNWKLNRVEYQCKKFEAENQRVLKMISDMHSICKPVVKCERCFGEGLYTEIGPIQYGSDKNVRGMPLLTSITTYGIEKGGDI